MSFTDTDLDSGHWCSRQDCVDVYRDLDSGLSDTEGPLNRQITIATDEAEAILRARWPTEWPFNSPTPALRHAVAAIATYRAIASLPLTGGEFEALSDGADHGWEFLADMAAGRARIDMTGDEQKVEQVRVQTPKFRTGNWGFSKELTG